jgi:hypothetical protein
MKKGLHPQSRGAKRRRRPDATAGRANFLKGSIFLFGVQIFKQGERKENHFIGRSESAATFADHFSRHRKAKKAAFFAFVVSARNFSSN